MNSMKENIRKELIEKRKQLTDQFVNNISKIIMGKVLKKLESLEIGGKEKCENIGLYFAKDNEVLTKYLILEILNLGKRVFLPKMSEDHIEFREIKSLDDLETGSFDILEPNIDCRIINPNEIDLLIIPCVGVDKHGNRIGRGKGCYDKFLSDFGGMVVCLAYDFQVVDRIKTDEFDKSVDFVVTEKSVVNCIMSKIIDGKGIANEILDELRKQVEGMGIKAKLCVILVGNNPGSEAYVKNKQKKCKFVGIDFELIRFSDNVSEDNFVSKIKELNNDSSVTGILVQLPLPKHINVDNLINSIDPDKDVDGLTKVNMEKLAQGDETLACATPKGIIRLLDKNEVSLGDKKIVVVGYGRLVGKPLTLMLKNRGFEFEVCDEFTKDIKDKTKQAHVLITGTGVPHLIKKDYLKQGVIVIDAGISKLGNKIVGDVDFENVKQKVELITPVPGGVGPMTVAMLIENVINAVSKDSKIIGGKNG